MLTYPTLLLAAALAVPPARAPAPAPSETPFKRDLVFEVPHNLGEVKVPELEARGIPVTLRAYKSLDNAFDLQHYFQVTFLKAGLFVPPNGAVENPGWGPIVVGYDPQTRISYSVILQLNDDGTTNVILGKARLAERRDTSKDGAIAPVFPGASDFAQSNLEGARGMSYTAKATVQEVQEFYRAVLPRSGYLRVEENGFRGPDNSILRVKVTPDPTDKKDEHISRVLVLRQRGSQRDDGSLPEPEKE